MLSHISTRKKNQNRMPILGHGAIYRSFTLLNRKKKTFLIPKRKGSTEVLAGSWILGINIGQPWAPNPSANYQLPSNGEGFDKYFVQIAMPKRKIKVSPWSQTQNIWTKRFSCLHEIISASLILFHRKTLWNQTPIVINQDKKISLKNINQQPCY